MYLDKLHQHLVGIWLNDKQNIWNRIQNCEPGVILNHYTNLLKEYACLVYQVHILTADSFYLRLMLSIWTTTNCFIGDFLPLALKVNI